MIIAIFLLISIALCVCWCQFHGGKKTCKYEDDIESLEAEPPEDQLMPRAATSIVPGTFLGSAFGSLGLKALQTSNGLSSIICNSESLGNAASSRAPRGNASKGQHLDESTSRQGLGVNGCKSQCLGNGAKSQGLSGNLCKSQGLGDGAMSHGLSQGLGSNMLGFGCGSTSLGTTGFSSKMLGSRGLRSFEAVSFENASQALFSDIGGLALSMEDGSQEITEACEQAEANPQNTGVCTVGTYFVAINVGYLPESSIPASSFC